MAKKNGNEYPAMDEEAQKACWIFLLEDSRQ